MSTATEPGSTRQVAHWRTRDVVRIGLIWAGLNTLIYVPYVLTRPTSGPFDG
jgi:hypothetical protein